MKARIKSTGEIVDVDFDKDALANDYPPYRTNEIPSRFFLAEQIEWIDIQEKADHDYWTRLEHQAAIAAMQGILNNPNLAYKDISTETICNHVAEIVKEIAHALVEKMKEKK